MKTALPAALTLLAGALPGAAQSVSDCDWRARADAVVEPWEAHTRTYANGAIRVALLDTIEPGAAALNLLVLSPPYDELGGRQCKVVGFEDGLGFAGLDFSQLGATYDPATGLTVSLPGTIFLPEDGFSNSILLHVTINQATGDVTARMDLGRE